MKKLLSVILFLLASQIYGFAQTNITMSNPAALNILLGIYNPANFTPANILNHPDSILNGIVNRVSKDSLWSYLVKIDSYHNRNTGSDTVSQTHGIGAVRRWIYGKYNEFSTQCENRLVTSYLDFDVSVCGQTHHRNVLALLPGLDTTNKEILVVEGHYDTRCQGVCDTACYSPGMEDNGSGTVLVMELARIMSRYSFNHTILFASVTGEDQGLYGATALSSYLYSKNIKIRSVFNNDVIGGVICGQTSSAPSCPGLDAIDSTHVRIFSYSQSNDTAWKSPHKQLARYIQLHQVERINPLLTTPMTVDIIMYEDRVGRSGDHIPFRQKGYTAIRFTSKNEHGNGSGTPPDRQHTSDDILGMDVSSPADGIIDSFFVNPNYLRRNIIMNGVNLGCLAIAPPAPTPLFSFSGDTVHIEMKNADSVYRHYRVGIRSQHTGSLNFDTVLTFTNTTKFFVSGLSMTNTTFLSVANVQNTVESLFSEEYTFQPLGIVSNAIMNWGIVMHQNTPNPFAGQTEIVIEAADNTLMKDVALCITDIMGRKIKHIPIEIQSGINRFIVTDEGLSNGIYVYSLQAAGKRISVGKMTVCR